MLERDGRTVLDSVEEVPISDVADIYALLQLGETQRRYGVTNMNERSSRSHTIFRYVFRFTLGGENSSPSRCRLTVESSTTVSSASSGSSSASSSSSGTALTVSQLNLVDLAGSERVAQTGAVGDRLKEGCKINNSLMTLGQVISKLSEGSTDHIPYRDSKLTRLLKASLGGNARTAIVCTVTPLEDAQTKSTLEFASRAKKIATHAEKNEILVRG